MARVGTLRRVRSVTKAFRGRAVTTRPPSHDSVEAASRAGGGPSTCTVMQKAGGKICSTWKSPSRLGGECVAMGGAGTDGGQDWALAERSAAVHLLLLN